MKKRKNNLKIILILSVFLLSLSCVYATAENQVLIVADNTAISNWEDLTSTSYYEAILNNITFGNSLYNYSITIWNKSISGNPSLSYLQSFSVYEKPFNKKKQIPAFFCH